MGNHNLKLPEFLSPSAASAIERILDDEKDLERAFYAVCVSRAEIPLAGGAVGMDDNVLIWADEDRMDGVPPKNLLDRTVYADGSVDYLFAPIRDEARFW